MSALYDFFVGGRWGVERSGRAPLRGRGARFRRVRGDDEAVSSRVWRRAPLRGGVMRLFRRGRGGVRLCGEECAVSSRAGDGAVSGHRGAKTWDVKAF